MKNTSFSTRVLAFGLLFIFLNGLMACKKDKHTLKDDLVGDWEIKSFTIDGVEFKGAVILASKMEFEAYTGSNGDFEWSINYVDGSSENQSGDYEVDVEDKEIDLENAEGEHLKFDFDLDGNDLELSGILDGSRYVLKAERD